MAEYLKQKIPDLTAAKKAELDRRDAEFIQELLKLKASKPDMVDDFQRPFSRDVPVEKINTQEVLPVKSIEDFKKAEMARQARKEAIKATSKPSDMFDFTKLTQKAKGIKKLSLGGLIGGAATALGAAALPQSVMASVPAQAGLRALDEGDPASLLMPGDVGPAANSLDERIERGTLTDSDKELMRQQARLNAIQKLR